MLRLTEDDFFSGFFAALVLNGYKALSVSDERFDEALAKVFQSLLEHSEERGLDVRFRIMLHPIHRDSATVRHGILCAMQRGEVTLDAPRNDVLRIGLTEEWAEEILASLPGGKELFMELSSEFLDLFLSPVRV